MIMPENFSKNLEQKRGPWPPPPPPPQKKKKKKKTEKKSVGFVLKKLLTYFEMLIVPHALQCEDGCFFVFYRIWHFASGILNSDLNSLAKFTY